MAEFLHEVVAKREGSPLRRIRMLPTRTWYIFDNPTSELTPWRFPDGSNSTLWLSETARHDANDVNEEAYRGFADAAEILSCTNNEQGTHMWILLRCEYEVSTATHYFECRHCQMNTPWLVRA